MDARIKVRSIRIIGISAGVIMMMASACLKPGAGSKVGKTAAPENSGATATQDQVAPSSSGSRSAIVRFSTSASGSFRTSDVQQLAPNGTGDEHGEGVPAVRLWGASNTGAPIADIGGGAQVPADFSSIAGWPKWIERVEVGISGPSNTRYSDASCMKFANAAGNASNCNPSSPNQVAPSYISNCRASEGRLAVSEKNCHSKGPSPQLLPPDQTGIFIRVIFNRAELGSQENILVDLKYFASNWNAPPRDPKNCFSSSGNYNPVSYRCTDQAWAAYLTSEVGHGLFNAIPATPFFPLLPPVSHSWKAAQDSIKSPISQQIVLPLSSDPSIKYLEITRRPVYWPIESAPSSPGFEGQYPFGKQAAGVWGAQSITACGDDSPLCVGIVFDSLGIYRI